jgi:predicted metal-dependent hydrolase
MKAKVTKISFKNMSSKFAYYSYPSCKVTFSLFVLAFDLDTIDYLKKLSDEDLKEII